MKRKPIPCECADSGCKVHESTSECGNAKRITLYRVDMEDRTGVYFCRACANDAMESGVFDTSQNFYSR